MNDETAIKCTKTRKCGWIGKHSDLVSVPDKDRSYVTNLVCPKCGHDEYYVLTEKEINHLTQLKP